jgi:hypothetical protein
MLLLTGPDQLELRWSWLLHAALRDLVSPPNVFGSLVAEFQLFPYPDIGLAFDGAGEALHELAREGVLEIEFQGETGVVLVVDRNQLRPYLKRLMTMPAEAAEALYLAGTAWRANCSTAAKTLAIARTSDEPKSASGIPNRCHRPPVVVR